MLQGWPGLISFRRDIRMHGGDVVDGLLSAARRKTNARCAQHTKMEAGLDHNPVDTSEAFTVATDVVYSPILIMAL